MQSQVTSGLEVNPDSTAGPEAVGESEPTRDIASTSPPLQSAVWDHDLAEHHAAPASGDIHDVDFLNDVRYAVNLRGRESHTLGFRDGEHRSGERFGGEGRSTVASILGVEYGDLDGDGMDEAVVAVQWVPGASGNFDSLHVFDIVDRDLVRVGKVVLGDRGYGGLVIHSITDGELRVVTFTDPSGNCCAGSVTQVRYELTDEGLRPSQRIPRVSFNQGTFFDDGPPGAIDFRPSGMTALVSVASGGTSELRFDVEQGQRIELLLASGGPAQVRLFDDGSGRAIAESTAGTLAAVAPTSGRARLELHHPDGSSDDASTLSLVWLAIRSSEPVSSATWSTVFGSVDAAGADVEPVRVHWSRPSFVAADEAAVGDLLDGWLEANTERVLAGLVRYAETQSWSPEIRDVRGLYTVTAVSDAVASIRWEWFLDDDVGSFAPVETSLVIDLRAERLVGPAEIIDVGGASQLWMSVLPEWSGPLPDTIAGVAIRPGGLTLLGDVGGAPVSAFATWSQLEGFLEPTYVERIRGLSPIDPWN